MENALWDVAPARESGVIPSFLQPLDKPVPLVETADIGRLAAKLLHEGWIKFEGASRKGTTDLRTVLRQLVTHG